MTKPKTHKFVVEVTGEVTHTRAKNMLWDCIQLGQEETAGTGEEAIDILEVEVKNWRRPRMLKPRWHDDGLGT